MIFRTLTAFLALTLAAHLGGFSQDTIATPRKDSIEVSGQLSAWALYNPSNSLPVYLGARYIPTVNYAVYLPNDSKFDMEGSVNLYGSEGSRLFDRNHSLGTLSPYRAWMRYSTKQLEIRLGLQKINFGSATLLRPLMWFDQVDPRDPLQLTNGVWGILGRYYFLNNANLWVWGLYGNDQTRPWDVGLTNQKSPELGGRLQYPVPKGEVGLTYDHRMANTFGLGPAIPGYSAVGENRIGLDGKWDLGVGVWFEGTWVSKTRETGLLTNQEMLNLGVDNTFGIGSGLYVVAEQLWAANDQKAFALHNTGTFSALSASYPISMIDNVNLISYYDWGGHTTYQFLNFKRQFNRYSLYLMAFWNPKNYRLPQQNGSTNFYSGKGIQLMFVFNH